MTDIQTINTNGLLTNNTTISLPNQQNLENQNSEIFQDIPLINTDGLLNQLDQHENNIRDYQEPLNSVDTGLEHVANANDQPVQVADLLENQDVKSVSVMQNQQSGVVATAEKEAQQYSNDAQKSTPTTADSQNGNQDHLAIQNTINEDVKAAQQDTTVIEGAIENLALDQIPELDQAPQQDGTTEQQPQYMQNQQMETDNGQVINDEQIQQDENQIMDKEYQEYCKTRFKEILEQQPDAKDDFIAAIIAGEWAQKLQTNNIIKSDPATFKDVNAQVTINVDESDDEQNMQIDQNGENGTMGSMRADWKPENGRPKKWITAYLFFIKDQKVMQMKQNPEMTFKEMMQNMSLKWKTMPIDTKQKYINVSALDKIEKDNHDKIYREFLRANPNFVDPKDKRKKKGQMIVTPNIVIRNNNQKPMNTQGNHVQMNGDQMNGQASNPMVLMGMLSQQQQYIQILLQKQQEQHSEILKLREQLSSANIKLNQSGYGAMAVPMTAQMPMQMPQAPQMYMNTQQAPLQQPMTNFPPQEPKKKKKAKTAPVQQNQMANSNVASNINMQTPGFLVFVRCIIEEILRRHPTATKQDIEQTIRTEWANLPQETRQIYEQVGHKEQSNNSTGQGLKNNVRK